MRHLIAPLLLLLASGCAPEPLTEGASEDPLGREEAAVGVGEPAHCVVVAETFGADLDLGPALRPPVRAPRCFKMFSEALSFATQGQVLLPEGASPGDVETALETWERSNTSRERLVHSHVIAIEYTDKDYRGASLTVQSEVSCDDVVISLNLPGAWNKVVNSARVFGNCRHAYHYENSGFKGIRADCDKRCPSLGEGLNQRASSIKWTR